MGEGRTQRADTTAGNLSNRVLRVSLHVSNEHGAALIAVGLGVCWAITILTGGTSAVPPHFFYVPILFAGIRFGALGSLLTALAAGVLAGPLTYAEVATRTNQDLLDWGARAFFFVVIGQILTAMTTMAIDAGRRELADLDAAKSMSAAMDGSRLEVYFQPIMSLLEGEHLTGAEALVRLHDGDDGIVGPDEFIPSAERNGMIRPLGEFVLRAACQQVVAWRDAGLLDPGFTLSVNVSPRQLDAGDFPTRVSGVLRETGMDADRLRLEVTETALARQPEQFAASLHALHRLGVQLALDDFGTGHSTLAEVQRLPVDVIKIDRVFVDTLCDGGSAIAANVVSLAQALGLATVAEGVETPSQAMTLRSLGCDHAQGFLYGRPVPGDQFALSLLASPTGLDSVERRDADRDRRREDRGTWR